MIHHKKLLLVGGLAFFLGLVFGPTPVKEMVQEFLKAELINVGESVPGTVSGNCETVQGSDHVKLKQNYLTAKCSDVQKLELNISDVINFSGLPDDTNLSDISSFFSSDNSGSSLCIKSKLYSYSNNTWSPEGGSCPAITESEYSTLKTNLASTLESYGNVQFLNESIVWKNENIWNVLEADNAKKKYYMYSHADHGWLAKFLKIKEATPTTFTIIYKLEDVFAQGTSWLKILSPSVYAEDFKELPPILKIQLGKIKDDNTIEADSTYVSVKHELHSVNEEKYKVVLTVDASHTSSFTNKTIWRVVSTEGTKKTSPWISLDIAANEIDLTQTELAFGIKDTTQYLQSFDDYYKDKMIAVFGNEKRAFTTDETINAVMVNGNYTIFFTDKDIYYTKDDDTLIANAASCSDLIINVQSLGSSVTELYPGFNGTLSVAHPRSTSFKIIEWKTSNDKVIISDNTINVPSDVQGTLLLEVSIEGLEAEVCTQTKTFSLQSGLGVSPSSINVYSK